MVYNLYIYLFGYAIKTSYTTNKKKKIVQDHINLHSIKPTIGNEYL